MLRSLYISASGMLAQRRTMDVISNNMANMDTVGYKKDVLMSQSFSDVMLSRINDPSGGAAAIGPMNYGVHADEIVTAFQQGSMEDTGRSADLALEGDGFFTVETPQGMRFTRAGNFQVDDKGYLCTPDGAYVRGTNGRIHVGSEDFTVDKNGNIASIGGNYKLQIVQFADNAALRKTGNNQYSGPATAKNATCGVLQGSLEGSNVDLATEMTNMMVVSRNYETNQRMISILNSTLEKTVNDIGRL